MDYRSAFIELIELNGLDVLDNNFLVRSLLLDKIGNSLKDKTVIDAYYHVNSIHNIHKEIEHLSFEESTKKLNLIIDNLNKRYNVIIYKEALTPLLSYLYPNKLNIKPAVQDNITKAKIVRANKTNCVTTISQTPPKPIVVPPTINPQKNKKTNNDRSLYIDMSCKKLIIKESGYNQIRILNKDGTNITKTISVTVKKDKDEIKLTSKRKEYTVLVPSDGYKKMSIKYDGKMLMVSNLFHKTTFEELNIVCKKGDVSAYCDFEKVNIIQNNGKVVLLGKAPVTKVHSNNGDIYCSLNGDSQNSCEIITKSGNIDISFCGYKVRPKINHLFTKINDVNGVYKIGKRGVNLRLKAYNGKIKVK